MLPGSAFYGYYLTGSAAVAGIGNGGSTGHSAEYYARQRPHRSHTCTAAGPCATCRAVAKTGGGACTGMWCAGYSEWRSIYRYRPQRIAAGGSRVGDHCRTRSHTGHKAGSIHCSHSASGGAPRAARRTVAEYGGDARAHNSYAADGARCRIYRHYRRCNASHAKGIRNCSGARRYTTCNSAAGIYSSNSRIAATPCPATRRTG